MCSHPSGCIQNIVCDKARDAVSLLFPNIVLAPASTHQTTRDAKHACCGHIIICVTDDN